jgi:hypothetical protein
LNTIFVHRDGRTEQVTSIDRSWLSPSAGAYIWVDLSQPSIPEALVLTDTFTFHRLSVDDAMQTSQSPKIEAYDGYLFAGIAGGDADVAFFVGSHYLVSVHWRNSKAIEDLMDSVPHGARRSSRARSRCPSSRTGGGEPEAGARQADRVGQRPRATAARKGWRRAGRRDPRRAARRLRAHAARQS